MAKKRSIEDELREYNQRAYGFSRQGSQNYTGIGSGANPGKGAEQSSGPAGKSASLEVVEKSECVVGVRMWGIHEVYPHGWRLTSAQGQIAWPFYKRMEARCNSVMFGSPWGAPTWFISVPDPGNPQPVHPSPDAAGKCYCGINAYKEEDGVHIARSDVPVVVGTINLWGRVIEYTHGWRGQYAYPKELMVAGTGEGLERIATKLELAYGVNCGVWT